MPHSVPPAEQPCQAPTLRNCEDVHLLVLKVQRVSARLHALMFLPAASPLGRSASVLQMHSQRLGELRLFTQGLEIKAWHRPCRMALLSQGQCLAVTSAPMFGVPESRLEFCSFFEELVQSHGITESLGENLVVAFPSLSWCDHQDFSFCNTSGSPSV